MEEGPHRAVEAPRAARGAGAVGGRHANPESWVRMTVSYTVEQHQWLRQQAFEQRTTIASVLRRCVSESRERSGGDGGHALMLPSTAAVPDHEPAAPPDWIRLSLSFTPDQHTWLWRRAFEERTTLAMLVRRYVSDARATLGLRTPPGPSLTLLRGSRARPTAVRSPTPRRG